MANFGEQHCRLCLETVNEEHFEEIKDPTKNILDFLLLKLDVESRSRYIMCNICSRRVIEALRFKSMCICSDNIITPYIDDEIKCSIDLKEIYKKRAGEKHLLETEDETLKDCKVCRLCLQLVKDEFIPTHEMAVDMVEMYIPEINLTVIQDPIVCKQCFNSFVSHSNFIKNCLEVNEENKSFCHPKVVDKSVWIPTVDSYIKTEELDIKSEYEQEDGLEIDSTVVRSVYEVILNKTEHREIKAEDEDEKSTAASVKDDGSINTVNQYDSSSNIELYHCNTCHIKSNHKGNWKKHQQTHNRPSTVQRYMCDRCNYKTKFKGYFINHQLRHKNAIKRPTYTCDTCSYKTQQKYRLKWHMLKHGNNSGGKVFQCDTCDYKTFRKDNFNTHLVKHKDIAEVKLFECDICNFKSKQKSYLKKHLLRHKNMPETENDIVGSQLYKCDVCNYESKWKHNLKNHLVKHKDVSGVEFKCDTCDYNAKDKHRLKKHQLRHKNISETVLFECGTCDFKTKYRYSLKTHQLIHKDVSEWEVFECDTCDFKTRRKSNLTRHQLIHKDISEIKVRFECDTCNYKTNRKYSFKKHQLTHF